MIVKKNYNIKAIIYYYKELLLKKEQIINFNVL